MSYGYEVDFEGTGELLRVQAARMKSERGLESMPKRIHKLGNLRHQEYPNVLCYRTHRRSTGLNRAYL
jgi:hypothetical protein